jgi:5-formaminoimidazole-4-carboxamide-1-beta-D-ribofuranosyl 5'-monophosphate synthetase
MKNEIYSVFCDYVTNEESGLLIKKKIKDYIDIDGYSPSYVYFALYYAIKNKIKFKSIFGLKYLLDRDKVKQEYANVLDKYKPDYLHCAPKIMQTIHSKLMAAVKEQGYFIPLKANITEEKILSKNAISKLYLKEVDEIKFILPVEESNRCLVKYLKEKKTDKKYPRKFSEIKKRAL